MKGIIILDEIPENCDECDFNNHCGMCLVDGGRCDYKSKVRPGSCPIEKIEQKAMNEVEVQMAVKGLKRQKKAEYIRNLLIDVGQKDKKKFKLGEEIRYSPCEVYDILIKYGADLVE